MLVLCDTVQLQQGRHDVLVHRGLLVAPKTLYKFGCVTLSRMTRQRGWTIWTPQASVLSRCRVKFWSPEQGRRSAPPLSESLFQLLQMKEGSLYIP